MSFRKSRASGANSKGRVSKGSKAKNRVRWGSFACAHERLEDRRLLSVNPADEATFRSALAAATNLNSYTTAELNATHQWVVGFTAGHVPAASALAAQLNAKVLGPAPFLPLSQTVEFPNTVSWQQASALLGNLANSTYNYPLVARAQARYYIPNDPYFKDQWHLQNTGQFSGATPGADANVVPAWDKYQGRGVTIGIVDDSLQFQHPDLAERYRPELSHDFRGDDDSYVNQDDNPQPIQPDDNHGTAVGGVAAANGDNGIGMTGSAPLAELAGIRLIGGGFSDAIEASALSLHDQSIDIYNNSWGPGRTRTLGDDVPLAGIGPSTALTFANETKTGRGGLGTIYTFAAGNSKEVLDNTNLSNLANSRYVITVAALDDNDKQSSYSNPGASLFVGAPSNSNFREGIRTTDRTKFQGYNSEVGAGDGDAYPDLNYTSTFGGTSSATPLVTGVIALILEANPTLTYRDVQNILAETARKNNAVDLDWANNGAGFHVNHKYGFGAIDAAAAVTAAETWTHVLPEQTVNTPVITVNKAIPDGSASAISTATINADIDVEWVEVTFNALHGNIGDLQVVLTSPSGTHSVLAEKHFDSSNNYSNWVFTTNRNWGESSRGTWTLEVSDQVSGNAGTFTNWTMSIHGPITRPPQAVDDQISTNEDTPVTFNPLVNDFDKDANGSLDKTSVSIDTPPLHGVATVNIVTGEITYTPNKDYNGPDEFTYKVLDNKGAPSRAAKVSVTVIPQPDNPEAKDDVLVTQVTNPVDIDILANDSDPDGNLDPTSVAIVANPAHGTVVIDPGTGKATYTADGTFDTSDSFSYTVNDNDGNVSNVAQVTITKSDLAPVAQDDNVSTEKNVEATFVVLGNDSDDIGLDVSTVTILTSAVHGKLAVDAKTGEVVYTPDTNYSGPDSFTYTVNDGSGQTSNVALVSIDVADVGPPVALDDEFIIKGGLPAVRVITIQDNGGGNPLTVELVDPPAHGALDLAPDGTFTYNQNATFRGLDSFTYQVSDGSRTSNVATIRIVSSEFNGVRKLYADLLGRGAADSEILYWTDGIMRGFPVKAVIAQFLVSPEYRAKAVNDIYLKYLGRPADDAGRAYWVAQIASGLTLDRVTAEIVGTDEYFIRNGGSDTAFVVSLYSELLGRTTPPKQSEIDPWTNALANGASRAAVALNFIRTREFRANLIRGYYDAYLHRTADNDGLNFWVAQMQFGRTREFVQTGLLSSAEYFSSLK